MTHPLRPRRTIAVTGAAALLATVLVPTATAADDDPATLDDLIISEYVEGSSNNKALELYNGTDGAIDLSGYAVEMYFNGNTDAGLTIDLEGALSAGEVFVLAHSSAAAEILAQADQTSGAGFFNGDDAITLTKAGVVVDSLGQIGTDPGSQWGAGLTSTADNTLRRKPDVCAGDTVTTDAFDPAAQWDGYATDTFGGLGSHDTSCGAGDPVEPDPGDGDPVEPDPGDEDPVDPGTCTDESTAIGAVQGSGTASSMVNETVTVQGTVVGDFQHEGSFDGYYVQDAGDDDPATSDGIFVYAPDGADVDAGDAVRITGTVSEYYGMTQITVADLLECGVATLPAPVQLELPVTDYEPYEGMLVSFAEELTILEYFEYGRYGEIVAGYGQETARQYQPTAVHEPGSPEAEELLAWNLAHRITIDDGRGDQNPAVLRHPNGEPFSLTNTFRGGDTLSDVTGIIDYRFSEWKIQPTEGADSTATNPRPAVPEVGGTTTVASFNVLNYFTTLTSQDADARGADTAAELERQQAKIVSAINEMDADVVGLIEIENNGDVAVGNLVDALNAAAGEDRWAFVSTGVIGTDAITTALIYQPAEVSPVGDFAVLDSDEDPRFLDEYNRPALAQTFTDDVTGGQVTVVVNHLKSKGSSCAAAGDPEDPDGQGNCNGVRTDAADALGDWADADPTGTGTEDVLIVGDLNAYDKEDPIEALTADGFVDLLLEHQGEYAYSYVFDGMLGYLDYAMASVSLAPQVTGAAAWAINADEPSVLDYDMSFKPDAQDVVFAADPYRSSDHDPVLVGLDLAAPDTTAPELEVAPETTWIWPPNNTWVTVHTAVSATDDSGAEPAVTLVDATVTEDGKGHRGAIEVVSDSEFRLRAAPQAVYTLTYEATDAAGNSTAESVSIMVGKPPKQ
ncbi:ExeM/NucH family extracellular endonuclease [Georgenia sp. 10Sc9-8]|uniref:ExeM/NucH family extracellular endonuclease n=1 Tax=Georgenia halotolerans TaxID=3028317 RepID=A0ABT5TXX5_9MICO|nr:ExeM/NucH family extracellular endonuclease [Georgenia halotolerans]